MDLSTPIGLISSAPWDDRHERWIYRVANHVSQIEEDHDPRDTHVEDPEEESPDNLPHHPPHHHNPWEREAPDPDEDDIEHVEWNAGPGVHFMRTSFRSSSPRMRPGGPDMNDPFTPIFQTFATMLEGGTQRHQQAPGGPPHSRNTPHFPGPTYARRDPFMDFVDRNHDRYYPHTHANTSRLQEGTARQAFGSRATITGTARLLPRDANNPQPQAIPVDQLHGSVPNSLHELQELNDQIHLRTDRLLGSLLQNMHGMQQDGRPGAGNPTLGPPFHLFAQLFNPANAAHGDAVYTEEALDRVISQFMEAQNGSAAPGPASAAAIAALPKTEADKSMMGSDGKAECSVCMDNVEIGDEVTVLPCTHWFHGECVGAWLKEHDTCPHCRQGIMPKEPDAPDQPRSQGQAPRNSQVPLSPGTENPRYHFHSATRSGPSQSSRGPETGRRRSSARNGDGGSGSSGSSGGGISGWVRNHFGSERGS